MPKIIFDVDEIEASGESSINNSGNAYIHRKYAGRRVRWIVLKERGMEQA